MAGIGEFVDMVRRMGVELEFRQGSDLADLECEVGYDAVMR